jgi:hypothetical protein
VAAPARRVVSDTARRLAAFINEEIAKVVGPHSTFEQRQAAACAVMSDTLWFRTDGELRDGLTTADEIEVEDRRYYRLEQASSATYHSPWGSHYVEEALYREAGVHNGPTIKPIELHIGIIEHMTPDMARIVGELSADKAAVVSSGPCVPRGWCPPVARSSPSTPRRWASRSRTKPADSNRPLV